MTAARRATEQLATWPELAAVPSSCGTGSAYQAGSREIVHLHSERDADVHLTPDLIERLRDQLSASTAVRLHDGSDWVTVLLECDDDADLLVSLTSLSLQSVRQAPPPTAKGGSGWPHLPHRSRPQPAARTCNLGRSHILR